MKKCEYCGGNAESGCGAVETAAGLYLHYSKIECAEVLKLQVDDLKAENTRLFKSFNEYGKKVEAENAMLKQLNDDLCNRVKEMNEEAKNEKRSEPVQYCLCQPPTTATIKVHREECYLYAKPG